MRGFGIDLFLAATPSASAAAALEDRGLCALKGCKQCNLTAKLVWRREHPRHREEARHAKEDTEKVLEEEFGGMSFADLLAKEKEDARGGVQGALPVKQNLFFGEKY